MSIEEGFETFHSKHPEVYAELCRLGREWLAKGKDRWSVDAAFHVLRFQKKMAGLPDEMELYKLNNNYTSRYARLLLTNEPDFEGMFETRVLTESQSYMAAVTHEEAAQPAMFGAEPAPRRTQYT